MSIDPNVAVIYSHFPHYRTAVFNELACSDGMSFEFFYDPAGITSTIKNGEFLSGHHALPVVQWRSFSWQRGAVKLVCSDQADAYIFLGNPYILSSWFAAFAARLRGRPVLFWTHGWLRHEAGIKGLLRRVYYKLCTDLLVYGQRARRIGIEAGFPGTRIHVIYNSLDYEAQREIREKMLAERMLREGVDENKPYFLTVSRLVPEVRLDLAIEALSKLPDEATLVIIGTGEERDALESLAKSLGVDVHFLGAIYDEKRLAALFVDAIAVVSPGKVGLLAMHALAYGTPVITHDDFDYQMPEVEAIVPGKTGAFFKKGNSSDLAGVMAGFLKQTECDHCHESRRTIAIDTIEADYTPRIQAKRIRSAVLAAIERGRT
ncbi:glycosyltransferase family 4 protein [Sulfitobacter sp. SH24]|uniref:glycosyltransferase family 4 protein n=1 Tax=Sulfitobacter sp. SH24 TaxID=3421173 RepID=UPI003F508E28